MEIENQNSQLNGSENLDMYQKINQKCQDTKEKSIFYFHFYQTWYNKSEKQKMQLVSYDHHKMINFLVDDQIISLDKSKGMIASKSYSDLEIIQDLIYYDNHLQKFAKAIKWIQNCCLTSEALDPQVTRPYQLDKINIENLGETQTDNQRLIYVYSLLKKDQGESAYRFMQNQNMVLPLTLVDTIFPYHDYLLSDSNYPLNLQSQLIQNEIKKNFLVDIFKSVKNSEIMKERVSHYKKHEFKNLFDQQVGNINWLYSLRSAFITSQEKKTEGETLFFSYLCANKSSIQNYVRPENVWYENLWLTLKYLYVHEVIKRFLVIKGLLYDSIEQYYPSYDNSLIDFSEPPIENYRKLFNGVGIDQHIYDELCEHLNQIKDDKYEIQTKLILAYLNRDKQNEKDQWVNIFKLLHDSSKKSFDTRDQSKHSSVICEFNAKLAFTLLQSQLVFKDNQILNYYDIIVEYFVLFLITQDRQSEIIAFLKNLRDENITFEKMARYMASKQTELERKKIKQDMILYGYSDQQIQGILKELVNCQSSSYNNHSVSTVTDQSVIYGLKMFIESYQNNLYTCMMHFLSASRKFFENEKWEVYAQMRNDRLISDMIASYKLNAIPQNDNLETSKDYDPFLNQLTAYDDLLQCHTLLKNLNNVKQTANTIKNQEIIRSSIKKNNQNQMEQEKDNYKEFQLEKADVIILIQNNKYDIQFIQSQIKEFIDFCEKAFFKYNYKTRNHYIFIDVNVYFEQSDLQEYNSHNIATNIFKDLTSKYLLIFTNKCLEVTQSFKVQDRLISYLNKYYSPSYDAFTLFNHDIQESILKKSANVLTQNTKFMKTVLNL